MKALVVEKDDDGKTHAGVQDVDEARLPDADVTVDVEYSTLNYKDGLCLGPKLSARSRHRLRGHRLGVGARMLQAWRQGHSNWVARRRSPLGWLR